MAEFVRIGFTHAFFHLLEQSTFENALRETLAGGGDTDTNACIVGALLGALHGIDGIPTTVFCTATPIWAMHGLPGCKRVMPWNWRPI